MGSEHNRRGIRIKCVVCGYRKQPFGRSAPMWAAELYCNPHDGCTGYWQDPKPGSLWPGETCADFGYAHSHEATEETPNADYRTD